MTHQERLDGLYGTSRRRLSEHVDGILETYVKDFEVCGDYGVKMYLRGNAAGLEAENYIKEALGSADMRNYFVLPADGSALMVLLETIEDKEFLLAVLRSEVDF